MTKSRGTKDYFLSSRLVKGNPLAGNPLGLWGGGMRRVLLMTLGFSIGTVVCLPAMAAATVQIVQGKVSVNQGQGYKQIAAASAVSTGDKVMAAPGGRGRIVYADGCAVDVYPGAVVTVPEKCYQPMRAGLEEAPVAAPIPWVPLVAGAAIIAVGACAASGCFNEQEKEHITSHPRSPDGGNHND